jgi:hypothetical protein
VKRKSKNHDALLRILRGLFPSTKILEEYPIKIRGRILYIDIFIPSFNTAFEVNGSQHYKFSKFMHGTKDKFMAQKFNDQLKLEYCEGKKTRMIVFKDTDEITKQIVLDVLKEDADNER